jgi:UDP-N-acetylglucosamine/UDP-N-acetylgalactosamine diphosphorylase
LVANPQTPAGGDGSGQLEPVEESRIKNKTTITEMDRTILEAQGKSLIKDGKVGVVVLAGGQGSRLGFDGPKGKYDVGLPSRKSLFQILTERFFKAQMLAHEIDVEEVGTGADGVAMIKIPTEVQKCKMLVMTSFENHSETVQFFRQNFFFGGDESSFIFFPQAMLPALTTEGKIMMSSKSTLKLAPNGNGAFFDSLQKEQGLRDLLGGFEYVQIIGVDNILNKVLDPIQIGFTVSEGLDCSCKAVAKRDPTEKVGVIGKKNGHYDIVEYSELDDEQANARKGNGQLLFNEGSILIFLISAKFLVDLVT